MSAATAFRDFLDGAFDALAKGEAGDCERRAKAISALVRAERDVADYLTQAAAAAENDDDDAILAELERRLDLFNRALQAGRSDEELAAIAATGVGP